MLSKAAQGRREEQQAPTEAPAFKPCWANSVGAQVLGPHHGAQTVNTVPLALKESLSFSWPLQVQVTPSKGSLIQKGALGVREPWSALG